LSIAVDHIAPVVVVAPTAVLIFVDNGTAVGDIALGLEDIVVMTDIAESTDVLCDNESSGVNVGLSLGSISLFDLSFAALPVDPSVPLDVVEQLPLLLLASLKFPAFSVLVEDGELDAEELMVRCELCLRINVKLLADGVGDTVTVAVVAAALVLPILCSVIRRMISPIADILSSMGLSARASAFLTEVNIEDFLSLSCRCRPESRTDLDVYILSESNDFGRERRYAEEILIFRLLSVFCSAKFCSYEADGLEV